MSASRWIGCELRGSRSQPGLTSCPCASLSRQGGASSSGASAVRLSGAWWLKSTTSSSASVAALSCPFSHLNWGSSMLPSAVNWPVGVTIVPASATVSRAMKRIPGSGLQE